MKKPLLLLALLVGCADNPPSQAQQANLEHVTFDAPASWMHTDSKNARGESSTWVPEDNVHKESIIVSRARIQPGRGAMTTDDLAALLDKAQAQVPHVRASKPEAFTTPRGMHGVRIESDFIPLGATSRYHRIHAVMLDGTQNLVHVLYTAEQPDTAHRNFDLVVNSVHGEA